MLRVLLQYLLPLLLPFLLYAAYVGLAHGRMPSWLDLDAREWALLGGAGFVLLTISLFTWSLLSGSPPEEIYIPPHVENGEIVPGRTVAQ
jgi:Family of unknown function (DUF6111)